MPSIGAVGSAAAGVYGIDRTAVRASGSTPTPAVDPAERVEKLTRQLDSSLTNKIARIREQISSNTSSSAGAPASPPRLDIRA